MAPTTDGDSRDTDQNQTVDVPQADPLPRSAAQHQQLPAKNDDLRLARGANVKR